MMESMYSAETVPRKDMVVQGRDGPRWLRERDDIMMMMKGSEC